LSYYKKGGKRENTVYSDVGIFGCCGFICVRKESIIAKKLNYLMKGEMNEENISGYDNSIII